MNSSKQLSAISGQSKVLDALPKTDIEAESMLLHGSPIRSATAFLALYQIKRGHGMSVADAYEATMSAWDQIYLEKQVCEAPDLKCG